MSVVHIKDFIGVSAEQNIKQALERAKSHASYNALIRLTEERALERARLVDEGSITGRLAGVPFVVKDNYLAFDGPTTAASKILSNFEAPLQATVVEKLEAEGAICIGKANLDAFAHGSSTENSAYGVTKNAIDDTRVAGGSSGGSAVVTALGIVPFALGTDTGGSIRQPASYNGVVGYKPSYGMVSRFGVVAMASSTDCMGVLAGSVEDAELVMEIIAGRDYRDMTTLPDYFSVDSASISPKKIGLIKQSMGDTVDDDVRAAVLAYKQSLEAAGHTVEEVDMPIVDYALAMYYIIVPAEVTSNLARYDGIRYGVRSPEAHSIAEVYGLSRSEGFQAENKRRILIGSYVLSSGFFDAYYLKAQKARTILIQAYNTLFERYDILMTPVAPSPAFAIGKNVHDPIAMYLADIMTVPPSLAGIPAISVPAGYSTQGLPIGVQLIAQRKHDSALLGLARQMEQGA